MSSLLKVDNELKMKVRMYTLWTQECTLYGAGGGDDEAAALQ